MNDSASTPLRHALDRARDLIKNAHRIEVFTGAGMSADSGLATYRDPDSGIWKNVDPQDMATIDAWAKDPIRMWRWYAHRRHQAEKAQPNAGHIALAQWAKEVTVTTQNIDNLHERAGTDDVVHLHGSLFAFRCCMCGRPWRGGVDTDTPPKCPLCGNLVRPGVVWFGEALPQREWEEAEKRMAAADLVIIVGTSGVVYPAAGLPRIAHQLGTPIIEVSLQSTDLTSLSTVFINSTAADALPKLAKL